MLNSVEQFGKKLRQALPRGGLRCVIGTLNGNVDSGLNSRQTGLIWVRAVEGEGRGIPFMCLKGVLGNYPTSPDTPVIVGFDRNGRPSIVSIDPRGFLEQGRDIGAVNAADARYYGYVDLSKASILLPSAQETATTTIGVNPMLYRDVEHQWHVFGGGGLDLAASIPAAGQHRLACQFLKPDNTLEVQVSTAKSQVLGLGVADVQECQDASTPGSIPVFAWRLADAQSTISNASKFWDLRNWIPGATPKANLSATAAPTMNDDDGDGYSVGSAWVDETNDNAYVCADSTTGAAVWLQINGGTGTVTSVDLSTDVGWLTVGDNPVTTSGTITLNATAALTQNQVLATPDGTNGVVGLRALVDDDIPDAITIDGGTVDNTPIGATTRNTVDASDLSANNALFGSPDAVTRSGVLHVASSVGANVYSHYTNSNTGHTATDGLDVGVSATGSGVIVLRENAQLRLFTNNTERVVIEADGELYAQDDLRVAGKISINLATGVNTLHLKETSGSVYQHFSGASSTSDGASNGVDIGLVSGTNRFAIVNREAATVEAFTNGTQRFVISSTGNGQFLNDLDVVGAFSKGSGAFNIDHPKPDMALTHILQHSFVEAPEGLLIYRGVATLAAGQATVDLDDHMGASSGTFEALTRNVQIQVWNNETWDLVRGVVSSATISIESNNPLSEATIGWCVYAERNDPTWLQSSLTDDDGNLIIEKRKAGVSYRNPSIYTTKPSASLRTRHMTSIRGQSNE